MDWSEAWVELHPISEWDACLPEVSPGIIMWKGPCDSWSRKSEETQIQEFLDIFSKNIFLFILLN